MNGIAWKEEKENIICKIAGCLIIMVAAGIFLPKLSTIHVLFDEFGYTANAAYYAGYDWSSVASHSAYYGYGYGLILSIFMRIAQGNMALYYRMGIIFNILMLVGSFLISCNIGERLCKNMDKKVIAMAALLISFYPNTLAQSIVLWSETILYFLFWLSLWFLIRFFEKENITNIIGACLTVMYMYMVHQRAVAMVIAMVMIMSAWVIYRKKWKIGLIIVITLILMFCLDSFLKSDIRHGLWSTGLSKANDFSGQTGKIMDIFTTWKGFKALIIGASGKFYYILSASILFAGIFVSGVWTRIKNKEYEHVMVYAYIILAFLGALGVSSIFMLYGTRQDTLIYGRYTEYVIGPILLLGVLYLWSNRFSKKLYGLSIGAILLTGIIVYIKLRNTGYTVYNMICAIGLSEIFKGGQVAGIRPLIGIAVAVGLSLIMVCIIKKEGYQKIVLTICATLIFWGYTDYKVMHTIAATNDSVSGYKTIADELRYLSQEGKMPIYYVTEAKDFDSRYVETVQYYLPDIPIIYVNPDNWKDVSLTDGIVFLDQKCMDVFSIMDDMTLVSKNGNMYILTDERNILENASAVSVKKEMELTTQFMFSQTGEIVGENRWISTGEEGYIVYGPYMTLHKGTYQLSFKLNVNENNNADSLLVDVCSTGLIYAEEVKLDEKTKTIEVEFAVNEMTENVEFRVFGYEGTQIELSDITIQKLDNK